MVSAAEAAAVRIFHGLAAFSLRLAVFSLRRRKAAADFAAVFALIACLPFNCCSLRVGPRGGVLDPLLGVALLFLVLFSLKTFIIWAITGAAQSSVTLRKAVGIYSALITSVDIPF